MADILIIDDDIESAEVLAELMRAEGHTVRIGYNGQDGFDLAREHAPELALIDIDMPLLDGPGMTYEMFLHDMGLEDVPVAFLSGSPQIRDVAARVGTPYFLAKPYGYKQLQMLIARALMERIAPRWPDQPTQTG